MPDTKTNLLATLKLVPAWIYVWNKKHRRKELQSRRIPFSSNKLNAMHWSMRYRWTTSWKNTVCAAVMENRRALGKLPLDHPKIEIILREFTPMDPDNAWGACKPIIDGLKVPKRINDIGAGVIADDSRSHIDLDVKSEKVTRQEEECVVINIYRHE